MSNVLDIKSVSFGNVTLYDVHSYNARQQQLYATGDTRVWYGTHPIF